MKMQYKLQYDVSRCSKEVKRDFNIESVMSDDDLSFGSLEEFKSYVEILKEIRSDGSDITINEITFNINHIRYSIHDNITYCIIGLCCDDDDDDDDYTYDNIKVDKLIQAYIKASGINGI